ncbi:DUF4330 domain-containing protein [Halorussus amylolyticus]|uniref:DUF4330 domain-containing protein n=1 Tax=Halorussus amylolyticus TaxID=1126242 RepID=UPI00104E3926|nr:DUF4330 domain-containing protein [Halorussus amylolyticus]
MPLIDDKGRIFGTVNIIDALVVLLVLAVAAAGAAFVLGTGDQPNTSSATDEPINTTTSITFEITGVQPYVADAIPEGEIDSDTIDAVESKSTESSKVVVEDENGELHEREHPQKRTVTLELALNTTETDGDILYEDEPLEIGRELSLDLGHVTVEGTVTKLQSDS